MKATLKSIAVLATLAALGTGCASLDGAGNNATAERPDYIVAQMDQGSPGQ